ncbi:unnamed protein product [Arabidopsis halleri]
MGEYFWLIGDRERFYFFGKIGWSIQRNEGYNPMHHGTMQGLTGGRNPPKPKFNK